MGFENETPVVPDEKIIQLRTMFFDKLQKEGCPVEGGFHPADIDRVKHRNKWLRRFLEYNEVDVKASFAQLWATCIWRKTYGTNDLSEENVRMDYLTEGSVFARNRDVDGKAMLIFVSRLYVKANKNIDDVKKCLVYWLERILREEDLDQFTVFFDMANAGLSNMDMEYIRFFINTMKAYYPNYLNYIIVFDMPWILNATFKIIKTLLPARAVSRMRFVNTKSLKEFVSEENLLKNWGGKDDYVFSFEPENRAANEQQFQDVPLNNNNINKKVHFANITPQESPMSELAPSSFPTDREEGEMLKIIPQEAIIFAKSGNEMVGTVEIINIDQKPITYKIKTTAPEKFRVRPSAGVLAPGASTSINVVMQQGHQITTLSRDKFLVMCMSLGADSQTSSQDIAELWKNTPSNSAMVEQHRLKCNLPVSSAGDGIKNGNLFNSNMIDGDRQLAHFSSSISQLTDTTSRLEAQIKFNQTLQYVTLLVFLLLSVAIVYILKIEIKNNSSDYCIKHDE